MFPHGLSRTRPGAGYQPADLVVLGYLVLVSALLVGSPRHIPAQELLAAVHLGLLLAVAALRFVPRERPGIVRVLRDLYPLALLPLAYADIESLNRLLTGRYFDGQVAGWDQALFGCQISQVLHQWIPVRAVSEYAHLSYLIYSTLIPLVGLPLYLTRRRAEFRMFTTTVITTFATCYLVFIAFPVLGPFHHFGPIDPAAKHSYFAILSDRMLHRASAEGTAFPSSHVAAAVVVWAMCRRLMPRLSRFVLIVATGIFFGTVYGGFHYGVDALAGLIVGLAFGWLGPRIHAALLYKLDLREDAELSPATRPAPVPPRTGVWPDVDIRVTPAEAATPVPASAEARRPTLPAAAGRDSERTAARVDADEPAPAPQTTGVER
jgi:membrane-associated phospholipid phosphatase